MSLSKNLNPSYVLVHPRKTCPFITERLLIECKESNQTTKQKFLLIWSNVNFSFRHEQQEVLYRHHLIISFLCCFIHSCLCGTFCTVCSSGLVPILLVSSKGNQLDRRRRHLVGKQSKWFLRLNVLRLKDLSIDEMVGAWCFGCLSGPPGFTCWISFAPVFSLIYCWVLILALSPCYILIYMF